MQLAAGATLKQLRLFRQASITQQFGVAEGGFTLTAVTTPTGLRWSLTNSPNLTPSGFFYLVAVDSRDIPSQAKIIRVTWPAHRGAQRCATCALCDRRCLDKFTSP